MKKKIAGLAVVLLSMVLMLNVYAYRAYASGEAQTGSENITASDTAQTGTEDTAVSGSLQTDSEDTAASEDDAESRDTEDMSFTEKIAAGFATSIGKYVPSWVVVLLVSMMPLLELRAGLFVARFLNFNLMTAIPICIIGNIIPIPFILLFIKKIFKVLGKTKIFKKLVTKLEEKAMKKSSALSKGEFWGLVLFVGIPIPGTGAWMGSLVAALLDIDFKKAIVAELIGIVIATVIVSILSYGLLGQFI